MKAISFIIWLVFFAALATIIGNPDLMGLYYITTFVMSCLLTVSILASGVLIYYSVNILNDEFDFESKDNQKILEAIRKFIHNSKMSKFWSIISWSQTIILMLMLVYVGAIFVPLYYIVTIIVNKFTLSFCKDAVRKIDTDSEVLIET